MKTSIIAIAISALLLTGSALAGEIKTARLASAKPADPVESVAPELSKIVVLCAQEKDQQFKKAWREYVDENDLNGPKLKETIAWVSEEAASQRKAAGLSTKDEKAWAEERRKLMSEIADRALSPAR
jgi:hypothetical protein